MPAIPEQTEPTAAATPPVGSHVPERRNPGRLIMDKLKKFGGHLARNAKWTKKFLHGGK